MTTNATKIKVITNLLTDIFFSEVNHSDTYMFDRFIEEAKLPAGEIDMRFALAEVLTNYLAYDLTPGDIVHPFSAQFSKRVDAAFDFLEALEVDAALKAEFAATITKFVHVNTFGGGVTTYAGGFVLLEVPGRPEYEAGFELPIRQGADDLAAALFAIHEYAGATELWAVYFDSVLKSSFETLDEAIDFMNVMLLASGNPSDWSDRRSVINPSAFELFQVYRPT